MELNHRRSNLEVISDMLRLGEASKTKIMYSSNMSYRQLQRYLLFLLDRGFLEAVPASNLGAKYRVTERGRTLLQEIEAVLELLNH